MGLVWSVKCEEYRGEKWFFIVVVVREDGCHCVINCERRYCDNWDNRLYSYLVVLMVLWVQSPCVTMSAIFGLG